MALNKANVDYTVYYASEIDKHAITITQANYPKTVQLGNVLDYKSWDIDWSDVGLLLAGSPCQAFSVAGLQKGFDDPRGQLFFTMVAIRDYINERRLAENKAPVKFLFENVKLSPKDEGVFNEYIKVKPILLDSALVSAQIRKRNYWCNWEVTVPEDKGIKLQDVILDGVTDREKSYCLDTSYYKGSEGKVYLERGRRQGVYDPIGAVKQRPAISKGTIVGRRLNHNGTREDYNKNVPVTQTLEVRSINTEKSNCLTTVAKDNVLSDLPPGKYPNAYIEYRNHFRHLTPEECEILQTLPVGYTNHVSKSQRLRSIGNGWTVDMIVHILKENTVWN